jgi:cysteine-rich repeat protein
VWRRFFVTLGPSYFSTRRFHEEHCKEVRSVSLSGKTSRVTAVAEMNTQQCDSFSRTLVVLLFLTSFTEVRSLKPCATKADCNYDGCSISGKGNGFYLECRSQYNERTIAICEECCRKTGWYNCAGQYRTCTCASRYYCEIWGPEAVFPCPELPCPSGTFNNSVTCISGGLGRGGGSACVCTACPPGKYGVGTGITACTDCGSRKYGVATGQTAETSCTFCEAGKYGTATGQTSCPDCEAGKYDNYGFGGNDRAVPCSDCQRGKYNPWPGQVKCRSCAEGKSGVAWVGIASRQLEVASCQACVAGQYNEVQGSGLCTACGTGKYGTVTGRTAEASCTACGAGKYGNSTGQSAEASCTACGAGKYRVGTGGSVEASCTACGAGKYGTDTGQTAEESCTACGAGKFGVLPAPQAVDDSTGQEAGGSSTVCSVGTSTGTVRLMACRSDGCRVEVLHDASWGTVCSDDWGAEETTVACRQLGCGVGTSSVKNFGGGSGPIWMDNVVCSGSETSLDSCSFNGWGRHDCFHGLYGAGSGLDVGVCCTVCTLPQPGLSAEASCTACGAGKYGTDTGQTAEASCTVCGAGKYGTDTGQTAEESCTVCGAGKYGNATGQTTEASCTACDAGKYRNSTGQTAEASCTACGAGKYGTDTGQTAEASCKVCGAGKYGNATGQTTEASCTACDAGKYGNSTGQTAEASCKVCGAGKYGTDTGQIAEASCTACGVGKYLVEAGGSSCTACGAGKYGNATGQTAEASCTACGAGKYGVATGQTNEFSCSACVEGTYSSSGASTCSMCPEHSNSLVKSTAVVDCKCNAGYSGSNGGLCVAAGICGDSIRDLGERCDDGNSYGEDGCSEKCSVEPGFSCDNTTGKDTCIPPETPPLGEVFIVAKAKLVGVTVDQFLGKSRRAFRQSIADIANVRVEKVLVTTVKTLNGRRTAVLEVQFQIQGLAGDAGVISDSVNKAVKDGSLSRKLKTYGLDATVSEMSDLQSVSSDGNQTNLLASSENKGYATWIRIVIIAVFVVVLCGGGIFCSVMYRRRVNLLNKVVSTGLVYEPRLARTTGETDVKQSQDENQLQAPDSKIAEKLHSDLVLESLPGTPRGFR